MTNIAFKEWAVIVDALGSGRQTVIFRKGGIHEKRGEFSVDHNQFFLYPTWEHQRKEDLKIRAHDRLLALASNKSINQTVRLRYLANVEKNIFVSNEKDLARLSKFHEWSDEAVLRRFRYGQSQGLHVMLVRVFELQKSYAIKELARYNGCRSWVELECHLDAEKTTPTLTDKQFRKVSEAVKSILEIH